jgi:branched-chain amino acid transport system permease protein
MKKTEILMAKPVPAGVRSPLTTAWLRIVFALVLLVPVAMVGATGDVFYTQFTIKIMLYAALAMSLDLLVGLGGMISMGHAAFFGIGAYTAYLTSSQYEPANFWFVAACCIAASVSAATAVLPVLIRLRGIQFVLMTLALSQVAFFVVFNVPVFGGSDGVYIYIRPTIPLGFVSLDLNDKPTFYWLVAAFTLLVLAGLLRIKHSPLGLVLAAIKDKEKRVQAFGYRTDAFRAAIFVLAAVIASLAGMLDAYNYGFANPEALNWHNSGNMLLMVIVGGIGSIVGPAVGAAVVSLCQLVLSDITSHWLLVYGLLLVVVVFAFPKGLAGAVPRRWRPW